MADTSGTVLMIDDDEDPNRIYVDRLRKSGFEVVQCFNADDAINMVETTNNLILITLDIMMPPGHYPPETTQHGLSTGIEIYKDIRRIAEDIPIVCFTLRGGFSTADLNEHDANLIVLNKLECSPRELHEEINRMLSVEA